MNMIFKRFEWETAKFTAQSDLLLHKHKLSTARLFAPGTTI